MSDDPKKDLERKLAGARRIQMVHYLADRHDEGDKLKPIIAQLEQTMRQHGWKIPG